MLQRAALWMCFLFVSAAPATQAQRAWGTSTSGVSITTLAPTGTKALVLFFVATDCPVSNRTFPEMQRLREEFSPAGASFWYVYPNRGEKPADVAAHQASFDAQGNALLSPEAALVALTRAVATPEVSVLRPDGKGGWVPAYTGRVDNRFVRFGQERTQATEHYAEAAIAAVLAGRPVPAPVGTPVGCAIMNPGVHSR